MLLSSSSGGMFLSPSHMPGIFLAFLQARWFITPPASNVFFCRLVGIAAIANFTVAFVWVAELCTGVIRFFIVNIEEQNKKVKVIVKIKRGSRAKSYCFYLDFDEKSMFSKKQIVIDPCFLSVDISLWAGKWKVILSMGMQLTWPCGRALAVGVSYNLTHWQTIFQVEILFVLSLFELTPPTPQVVSAPAVVLPFLLFFLPESPRFPS